MNPLDWPGPPFLMFYAALGIGLVLTVHFVTNDCSGSLPSSKIPRDPCVIAFLRGGANEVLRVAVVSLLDRALLSVKGDWLVATGACEGNVLERAILRHFDKPREARTIYELVPLCRPYELQLLDERLIFSDEQRAVRSFVAVGGLCFLAALALVKIHVALTRGHFNIWFLVLLAIGFCIFLGLAARRRPSARGRAVLADLRTLLVRERAQVRQLRGAELGLVAAVFGVAAVSGSQLEVRQLFPRAQSQSGGCGSGGCGAACGASCGGGGGCAGGCGGCGG